MKSIKILSILAFVFAVAVFQSCEVDKCDAVICLNDGTCNEGVCECPTGYSGTLCGNHCSSDIVGTYTVTDPGNNCFAASFEIVRTSDTRAEVKMFDNSSGIAPEIDFTGEINADCTRITLDPSGALPSGFQGISDGTVDINGNTITVSLTANQGGQVCTATATK